MEESTYTINKKVVHKVDGTLSLACPGLRTSMVLSTSVSSLATQVEAQGTLMETKEAEVHCRKLLIPANALVVRTLSLIVQWTLLRLPRLVAPARPLLKHRQQIIVRIKELSASGKDKIQMSHRIPSSWLMLIMS